MITPMKVPGSDWFEPNSDFFALTCLVSEHSFEQVCTDYHATYNKTVLCDQPYNIVSNMISGEKIDLSFLKTVTNDNQLMRWALFTDSFVKCLKDSNMYKGALVLFDKIWKYDPYLGVDLLTFAVNTQSSYDWISKMLTWIDENKITSYMHSEYVLVLRTLVQALLNKNDSLDIEQIIPALANINQDVKASIFNYAECDCMPDLEPQQPSKPVCKITNQKKCFPRFFQPEQHVAVAATAAGGWKKTKKTKNTKVKS